MPSAGARARAGPSLRSLLGLLALVCLGSGCATTAELRGRLSLPAAAGSASETADGKPGSSASRAAPVTDAVIYVVPDRSRGTPAPTGNSASGSRNRPQSERRTVVLTTNGFEPRVLPVTAGSTVRFLNRDRVYHSPFSVSPACRFSLKGCAPGQERSVVFDTVGVVNLYCELHPVAAGFVFVRPDRLFACPRADGHFTLPRLAPGAYIVKAWHPVLGETSRRVKVTGGRPVELDLAWSR